MYVDVLLGLQWGDEGKGKIVDYLAEHYDIVARFQGGPNAGHTLKVKGETFVLHTIPSGVFHQHITNVIGNGVVIDPVTFRKEIQKLQSIDVDISGRLLISQKAHLILPTHKLLDAASEAKKGLAKIGSTLRGIGPTYMDQTGRNGLRVGDLLSPDFEEKYQSLKDKHLEMLRPDEISDKTAAAHLVQILEGLDDMEKEWMESLETLRSFPLENCEYYLNDQLSKGKKILAEGAQGSMLDINFGTYPYVTSSNTLTAGACIGLGISPAHIREVYGISKAYCTRVGSGPFPTELNDATGELLRKQGAEFGATTGRPRRCGWIDLPALRYMAMLNGLTKLIITKIDVLNDFNEIKVCTEYDLNGNKSRDIPYDLQIEGLKPVYKIFKGWKKNISGVSAYDELPAEITNYVDFLEDYLQTNICLISTGPGRNELVLKEQVNVV